MEEQELFKTESEKYLSFKQTSEIFYKVNFRL